MTAPNTCNVLARRHRPPFNVRSILFKSRLYKDPAVLLTVYHRPEPVVCPLVPGCAGCVSSVHLRVMPLVYPAAVRGFRSFPLYLELNLFLHALLISLLMSRDAVSMLPSGGRCGAQAAGCVSLLCNWHEAVIYMGLSCVMVKGGSGLQRKSRNVHPLCFISVADCIIRLSRNSSEQANHT